MPEDIFSGVSWTQGVPYLSERLSLSSSRVSDFVREMGPPRWKCSLGTGPMEKQDALGLHARIRARGGAMSPILVGVPVLPRPSGAVAGDVSSAQVSSLGPGASKLRVQGLPESYRLRDGDFISVDGQLHQVVSGSRAGESGETGVVEVLPPLSPRHTEGSSLSLSPVLWLARVDDGSLDMKKISGILYRITLDVTQVLT